jgi:hypothetical protein
MLLKLQHQRHRRDAIDQATSKVQRGDSDVRSTEAIARTFYATFLHPVAINSARTYHC